MVREALENEGIDTSKTMIVDRSKYMAKIIPDVLAELKEKYGSNFHLNKPEIKKEAIKLIEKRFHKSLKTPKKWNAYYLLQHCKLPGELNISKDIKVIPFVGWPCKDYVEIVRLLANKLGPLASVKSEEALQKGEESIKQVFEDKNPTGLIILNNIEANSEKEVYDKTFDFAKHLASTLSFLTSSNMEILVWLFEGKINGLKLIYPNVFFWHYTPTYTSPAVMEDVTRKILHKIPENYLVQLALKYENEALSDSEAKFTMLKRWSALEYISEEYSKDKSPLISSEDRRKIVNFILNEVVKEKNPEIIQKINNNVAQMNRKTAKDKVRDLLNWCDYPLSKLDKNKDVLDAIYQNRNCITHSGGCYKYEPEFDECNGPTYCKKSSYKIENLNRELSRMLKAYVGKTINVTFGYDDKIPSD